MIKEAIAALVAGKSLTADEAAGVMGEIMQGEATPAQFGAFVTALRIKGETAEELTGLARMMRAKVIPIAVPYPVVDTCGTGGDGSGTFNISTAAAIVAAAAGVKVAKHGNRAASSQCGSADVLESLGVIIDLAPERVKRCLDEVGICFMFAPLFHPAMKYAAAPRREVGIRTVFNVLGPLTNPAGAESQLLGVADAALLEKMALVLKGLGSVHALVVHGGDGLDEITVCGNTGVCELKDGEIVRYTIDPEDFGLAKAAPGSLKGGDAKENAALFRDVLAGTPGPKLDAVLLNAAAVLYAGDKVSDLKQGVALARETIFSGRATAKLQEFIEFSRGLK
jgi:anthranilate phosphoribosyltransferase